MPTWSHDSQWLYFSWQADGARDIWRVHLTSGVRERVTRGGGGLVGRESADGSAVYFQRDTHDSALLAQPLTGGPPRTVLPCVTGTAYTVTSRGIYYVPCGDARSPDARLFDPVTGADQAVVRLVDYQYTHMPSGFAASPDGRRVFYDRWISRGADLMLLAGFR